MRILLGHLLFDRPIDDPLCDAHGPQGFCLRYLQTTILNKSMLEVSETRLTMESGPLTHCFLCRDHMRYHGEKSKLYCHLCSSCGRGFAYRKSLAEHMHVHSGERPYKCDICPKSECWLRFLIITRCLNLLPLFSLSIPHQAESPCP